MPIIKYRADQAHHPGCWQWASHWYCAALFIHRFREAAKDVLNLIYDDYHSEALDSATDALQELLDETEPTGVEKNARTDFEA